MGNIYYDTGYYNRIYDFSLRRGYIGFFSGLSKVLQGKPIYEPTDTRSSQTQEPIAQPVGPKAIPVVQIRRVECLEKGANLELHIDIHNDFTEPILLDKIMLLGTEKELDTTLLPGEARQFYVYSRPQFTNQPRGYAEVQYRKQDGDYFSATHVIRSKQDPDGTWDVTEFTLQLPIRDLH